MFNAQSAAPAASPCAFSLLPYRYNHQVISRTVRGISRKSPATRQKPDIARIRSPRRNQPEPLASPRPGIGPPRRRFCALARSAAQFAPLRDMSFMNSIFLTGASGFIGQALAARLASDGHRLRLAARSPLPYRIPPGSDAFYFTGLDAQTDWSEALAGIDVVVHCAARVHVMAETAADPLAAFRRSNVDAAVRLARHAARAGVGRFVFISTAKVHGEQSLPGHPFTVDTPPAPVGPYAISKLEAERALFALTASSPMQVVAIRPPLVYGPGVRANFLRLMYWLDRGLPLPLSTTGNRRSLIALDNLVDLIARTIQHPAAANHILLASDGEDLSTAELLVRLGAAMGRKPRLLPVPRWLLRASAGLLGRYAEARRLNTSFQLDISHTRHLLDWTPPVSVDAALASTIEHFRNPPAPDAKA
jgi:UDP-glucose 4-epimerase